MTIHPSIWPKLVCPICLHTLSAESDSLHCPCAASYLVVEGVPIMLVEDEHLRIKKDEIAGEVVFNRDVVPLSVHEQRNRFVNRNTEEFLDALGISLAGRETLIVGCSLTDMRLCCRLGAKPVGLDIVPSYTIGGSRSSRNDFGLDVGWICGDGECLPFADGSFEIVFVRQALHHMVKYRAALAEFLRVTRYRVLIVEEPFAPGAHDAGGDIRREYQAGNLDDPEGMLADKYHDFTLSACLTALRSAGAACDLYWARETAWSDHSGPAIQLREGPNPARDLPMAERLVAGGCVSIDVRKRPRAAMRAMSRESVIAMLN